MICLLRNLLLSEIYSSAEWYHAQDKNISFCSKKYFIISNKSFNFAWYILLRNLLLSEIYSSAELYHAQDKNISFYSKKYFIISNLLIVHDICLLRNLLLLEIYSSAEWYHAQDKIFHFVLRNIFGIEPNKKKYFWNRTK